MYMEIAKSEQYDLLCPECKDEIRLYEAWNEIVIQNAKDCNNNALDPMYQAYQEMAILMSDYFNVRARLIKLHFVIDTDYIKYLKYKGIKINTTVKYEGADGKIIERESAKAYADSLEAAMNGLQNYITQIKMKQKALATIAQEGQHNGDAPANFEQVIANLAFAIAPVQVQDDIKLIRFNEYNKLLKEKNKAIKEANGRGQY